MSAAPALLPCPFCQRRMTRTNDYYHHAFQRRGPRCVAESINILAADEKAIAAWNRRPAPVPGLEEAIRIAQEVVHFRDSPEISIYRYIDLIRGLDPSQVVTLARALLALTRGDGREDLCLSGRDAPSDEHSRWLPSETKPRDHFPVLTWSINVGRVVAFLDVTWTWWPCPATEPLAHAPTHWQPLPSPPSPEV